MELNDKVFVVTGGGNGIGREVVLELVRRRAVVAAVDRSEEGLAGTVRLAGERAERISTHVVDITDRQACEALPDVVVRAHGQVDGLVNVAGIIQPFVHVADLAVEQVEKVMAVNFWGTVYLCKAFLPSLTARPAAALLNVSSMGGLVPVPGQGAYGASKAAVKLFTETLQAELMDTSVAVTVVFPGGVGTNITGNSGVQVHVPDGAKVPKVTAPDEAGRQIVDAIAAGEPRLLIGKDAKMLDRMARVTPTKAILTVAKQMKSLLGS
ncbi:MAG: SDR family oxidoreductase [Micrococcales bacterium]|nr:SDR family oxidoreductase [Micrococcales bacterium]